MTFNHAKGTETDDLLKKALADDLPADVEAGMRERIRRFRAWTAGEERVTTRRAWLSRRTVWAAVSILMLVAGILLQATRSRNPLADKIARLKVEYANAESIRR